MKILNSVRFRITVAYVAFATVLAVVYGVAVWWGTVVAEDEVFSVVLEDEVLHFVERHKADPAAELPKGNHFQSYLGAENLPPEIRSRVSHTTGTIELKDENYYISARPFQGDVLYVVMDVSDLEVLDRLTPKVYLYSFIAGLIAVLIAMWIGRAVSSRILAPVVSLASLFRDGRPDALPRKFASDYYDDEIGFLARTLEDQVQRIDDFVDHEVRFSRDASHELRTPVTSIKLALDVMQTSQEPLATGLRKPLERIRRANSDMEHLIDTLLWLSRERRKLERAGPVGGPVEDAMTLIHQCVDTHSRLIRDKEVVVDVDDATTRPRQVHRDLFSIAVSNLIRNAFAYTESGKVRITLTDEEVSVVDSGMGLTRSDENEGRPRGYGFGLEIVRRICHRCGWQFDLGDAPTQGTRATVRFASDLLPQG